MRSINSVTYNTVYGTDFAAGAKEVDVEWAAANLKTDESVEKLTQEGIPSGEPKINGIGLTTIWKTYNSTGFGGSSGHFWSCVAKDEYRAWHWTSRAGESGNWNDYDRDSKLYVCCSRAFN